MSEEEKQALIEMKQNCLNASVYDDEKRLLKANAITMALMTIEDLKYDNKLLKDKINKAVEYIENNSLYDEEYDYNYEEEMYLSGIDDEVAKKDLLSLLKGDKE